VVDGGAMTPLVSFATTCSLVCKDLTETTCKRTNTYVTYAITPKLPESLTEQFAQS
jgi:hypothetical protein